MRQRPKSTPDLFANLSSFGLRNVALAFERRAGFAEGPFHYA
jgi:hypothetical protein